jgi:hypothetical protein
MKLYIVIAAQIAVNEKGQSVILYDDSTEKFILDPDELEEGVIAPSILYQNYLQNKFKDSPQFNIIRQLLNVDTSIDIDEILVNEAKSKLSEEELNAIIQKYTKE